MKEMVEEVRESEVGHKSGAFKKDELCGRPFHLQSHLAALNVVYSAVGLFVVASDEAF